MSWLDDVLKKQAAADLKKKEEEEAFLARRAQEQAERAENNANRGKQSSAHSFLDFDDLDDLEDGPAPEAAPEPSSDEESEEEPQPIQQKKPSYGYSKPERSFDQILESDEEDLEAVHPVLGPMIEECGREVRKVVGPILQHGFVQGLLENAAKDAQERHISFEEALREPQTFMQLVELNDRIRTRGDEEVERLNKRFGYMLEHIGKMAPDKEYVKYKKQREEMNKEIPEVGGISSFAKVPLALDFGNKYKQEGLALFKTEKFREAIDAWQKGDEALKRFGAHKGVTAENKDLIELHCAILRNVAQAAIKLESWNEALDAANRALELNDCDHKAWFRKACALEGIGSVDKSATCLDTIERIAVNLPDRANVLQEIRSKREKLRSMKERSKDDEKQMAQKSLNKGIFANGKDAVAGERKAPAAFQGKLPKWQPKTAGATRAKPSESVKRGLRPGEFHPEPRQAADPQPQAELRPDSFVPVKDKATPSVKRAPVQLTDSAAADLLDDLYDVYTDSLFVERVEKLIGDIDFDVRQFMQHMGSVAVDASKPVLEKYGFEASKKGMAYMQAAIEERSQGPNGNKKLREKALKTRKAMYGPEDCEMYERMLQLAGEA
eukprot:gnl/TRDRNA2_/TRDRNA2_80444_c0_seq1.p1 gnl/TRDRNA2_/TRDRNA2_80444_c0~~gnl/TRDRNA2_/TRDRNA2_80444_c0_seq1.p1  ORF type:complete len:611 (+),score=156.12 gnl/TRDRNA2_/TRDRNA2_80444_c0_seq1:75-1907(+)